MRIEPDILSTTREGPAVRLRLRVPADLVQFRGHFEACPLLPGVTQVDWAIRYGRQHFGLPKNFRRLSALKFMKVTTPGTELDLLLSCSNAGELTFRYSAGDATHSSGRVLFAD